MFYSAHGRWQYAPHDTFKLPVIEPVRDEKDRALKVPFFKGDSKKPSFYRKLYRLRWPGEIHKAEERVPSASWKPPQEPHPEPPPVVAYHLGVNKGLFLADELAAHQTASVLTPADARYPVGGLPAARVTQVIDARFTLDHHALETLKHLKWQAESWRHNPHLKGFDTIIRDRLHKVCVKITQMYFTLLGDYLYDEEARYFNRSEWTYHWWEMAGHLFWVGRTGHGLLGQHSGVDPDMHMSSHFEKTCSDIQKRQKQWEEKGYESELGRTGVIWPLHPSDH